MPDKETIRLRELAPRDELAILIQEAEASVEQALSLEDAGWGENNEPQVVAPLFR